MVKPRPVYKRLVDLVALLLIGGYVLSLAASLFYTHGSTDLIVRGLITLAFGYWFVKLVLEVRYLWTFHKQPRQQSA